MARSAASGAHLPGSLEGAGAGRAAVEHSGSSLTFPEGTWLAPGRPSVRLPGGKRVYVGDRFQVSIGDLSLSNLSGLPRRCQQGSDDVVHEVAG